MARHFFLDYEKVLARLDSIKKKLMAVFLFQIIIKQFNWNSYIINTTAN